MKKHTDHQCSEGKSSQKGYGPTSFWLQPPDDVFDHLPIHNGMVFLDAGCGAGEYSLHAARILGEKGKVIALDSVELSVEKLVTKVREKGMAEITGYVCDMTKPLPLDAQCADIILLSTVLHIKKVRDHAETMFNEFKRLLRPNGLLAILECKKEEVNWGPPLHARLSADDVEAIVAPCGFKKESELVMEHSYVVCFGHGNQE